MLMLPWNVKDKDRLTRATVWFAWIIIAMSALSMFTDLIPFAVMLSSIVVFTLMVLIVSFRDLRKVKKETNLLIRSIKAQADGTHDDLDPQAHVRHACRRLLEADEE